MKRKRKGLSEASDQVVTYLTMEHLASVACNVAISAFEFQLFLKFLRNLVNFEAFFAVKYAVPDSVGTLPAHHPFSISVYFSSNFVFDWKSVLGRIHVWEHQLWIRWWSLLNPVCFSCTAWGRVRCFGRTKFGEWGETHNRWESALMFAASYAFIK